MNVYREMKDGDMSPEELQWITDYIYLEEGYDGTGNPAEAAARQVGGNHYVKYKIQPLDIIDEYGLDFYLGNVLKYILREKGSKKEDIDKAIHYLELYKERVLDE
jgi:hypothetical protein